ncbi:MAG TPA: hypothetical protein VFF94_11040, partial [Novosphingobium sp.]|nr:hypothetical protein [Novosphingobium sp.]
TYSATQEGAAYQVIVARLHGSAAADPHVIDRSIAAARRQPGLALDASTSHSYGTSGAQACGRQFGFAGKDGALLYRTLFYNPRTERLYDIRSEVSAAAQADHGADVVHFQQSFALLADPGAKAETPPPSPASWQDVAAPDKAFTIRFPAAPRIRQEAYRTATGAAVPATVYEARAGAALYRLTAIHLWQTAGDGPGALDSEIARFQHSGTVLEEGPAAIPYGQCGRAIALRTPDGTRREVELFFPSSQHRLYLIEVRHKAESPVDPLDLARFRLSFALAKPE